MILQELSGRSDQSKRKKTKKKKCFNQQKYFGLHIRQIESRNDKYDSKKLTVEISFFKANFKIIQKKTMNLKS